MSKPLREFSQQLRKNMTPEEKHLWYDFLKTYPVQFRRQVPFGPYIVDFFCAKAKLVVELDGSQHYQAEGVERDHERTKFLENTYGLEVLHFSNLDVKQRFEGVCVRIDEAVRRRAPSSVSCADSFPLQGGSPKDAEVPE